MFRCLIVLIVLGAAGCSSKHELAQCKGPLIALNSRHWAPSPDELVALDKLCPEDK
jgi:hypothetical protein